MAALLGGDSNTSAVVGRGGGNGRLILNSGTVSLGAARVFNIDQLDTDGRQRTRWTSMAAR